MCDWPLSTLCNFYLETLEKYFCWSLNNVNDLLNRMWCFVVSCKIFTSTNAPLRLVHIRNHWVWWLSEYRNINFDVWDLDFTNAFLNYLVILFFCEDLPSIIYLQPTWTLATKESHVWCHDLSWTNWEQFEHALFHEYVRTGLVEVGFRELKPIYKERRC